MENGGGAIAPKNQLDLEARHRGTGDTPSGHVGYMDKTAGIKFRSDTVSNLVCQGNKATILGTGTADTTSGRKTTRYRVGVTDNGNPGKNSDTFSIVLEDVNDPSTGASYAAGGPLVDGNVHVRPGG
jgi:hypothetical protein